MHIALIGSRSSIHVVRWANAIAEKGHQVTMFSMHEGWESFRPQVRFIKLPFKNPFGYVLNILFLRAFIRDVKPDIVHSFYAFGHGFLGRYCSQEIPHVVSVLGSDIFDDIHHNKLYKRITVQNILQADAVCSTSNVMARQIEKECSQKLDIHITPFGIDTKVFSPSKTVKKENSPFVIGTVKWLEYKYGIDILIRAFADFARSYSPQETTLLIVGSGSKEDIYKGLARELGIESQCEFAGPVKHAEVPRWLAKMDVYAALSRLDSESFGVAILEASAMKLPVVVSNAGGLPEVVVHEKTGLVVEKENIKQASKAFQLLFENEADRLKLGKEGRNRVVQNYRWEQSVQGMLKVYQNLS